MNTDRVIKSNAGIFNSETWAGGARLRNTVSARGNRSAPGGSANLLHEGHRYSEANIEDALPFVQLLVPVLRPLAVAR